MPIGVLLFLFGILFSLEMTRIPAFWIIVSGMSVSFALLISSFLLQKKYGEYFSFFMLGLFWAFFMADKVMSQALPKKLENKIVTVEGYISSIPVKESDSILFNFHVLKLQHKVSDTNLRLSCFHCPYQLHAGENWRFQTKLKLPHSLMNPGSFDKEKNFFLQKLNAEGVVIKSKLNCSLPCLKCQAKVQRLRETLQNKLLISLNGNPFGGILVALALGITTYITPAQWKVFRATGTNHLVAISGLHIGLVSGLFSKLVGVFWRRIPYAVVRVPAPYIEALAGVLAATTYSILAGLSPSTQRSLIMVGVFFVATLSRRYITTSRCLILAFGVILGVAPFTVMSVGFWLSFIAVGLLVYGMNGRLGGENRWLRWSRPQWVVSIGMLPTVLYYFQQATLLSIPANLVAIPWVSFLVVPTCLLGFLIMLISKMGGSYILGLSIYLLQIVWYFLEKMANFSILLWHCSFHNQVVVVTSHLAAYICLLPAGLVQRLVAIIWWLPLMCQSSLSMRTADLQFVTLDVGQGLAALIRTKNHVLLFDTGVKKSDTFDMGKLVIIPYLQQLAIAKIDAMTISHGDNDHIGGANSVLQSVVVAKIFTSVPERFKNLHPIICRENLNWYWDGVHFTFLSPSINEGMKGNNASCVLKVSVGVNSILLTGDIEADAEQSIIMRHRKELRSNILLSPHHGSKTSSTDRFLDAVSPRYVVISSGYLNSYHHPHLEVIKRYRNRHISLFNTVNSGAITMTMQRDSDKVAIQEYRRVYRKFWHQ